MPMYSEVLQSSWRKHRTISSQVWTLEMVPLFRVSPLTFQECFSDMRTQAGTQVETHRELSVALPSCTAHLTGALPSVLATLVSSHPYLGLFRSGLCPCTVTWKRSPGGGWADHRAQLIHWPLFRGRWLCCLRPKLCKVIFSYLLFFG